MTPKPDVAIIDGTVCIRAKLVVDELAADLYDFITDESASHDRWWALHLLDSHGDACDLACDEDALMVKLRELGQWLKEQSDARSNAYREATPSEVEKLVQAGVVIMEEPGDYVMTEAKAP